MHHNGHRADGLGRRVVVTGMAGFSPVGNDWDTIKTRLQRGESGIRHLPEWDVYDGLNTRLGAPVEDFSLPAHYHRKALRSMGRGARMATRARAYWELSTARRSVAWRPAPAARDAVRKEALSAATGSLDPRL